MKIIQLSDLHLTLPGVRIDGRDPHDHLIRAIDYVNAEHADADLVVLTGDLANDGERVAYQSLRAHLDRLTVPWRATMGNHDDRAAFGASFPDHVNADGFVQSLTRGPVGAVVVLDTLDQGVVAGRLCETRLTWLQAQLDAVSGEDVYIFLHHPPMPIGLPALDAVRLEPASADALAALCQTLGRVKMIAAGHVHRPSSGLWRGLPFVTVRSTCAQSALIFENRFAGSNDPAGITLHLIDSGERVSHVKDFT